jgi:hypothetical protein
MKQTKPKHTKGPWIVAHNPELREFYIDDPSEENCLALVTNTGIGLEEQRANAHLIANSPMLLEALELCKEAMISSDNEQRLQKLEAAFKAASEAISKAKGGAV